MSVHPNGPRSVEGDQVRLAVLTVPRTGVVVVRFLGELRSMWTHFKNGHSHACKGEEFCGQMHREKVFWKAYAPIEYRSASLKNAWVPAVLEVTEGLSQFLSSENPRGEVWQLARERVSDKRSECRGRLIRTDDPRQLRRDVTIEAVVSRLYRCNQIAWDMPKPFGDRQWLLPTFDQVEDAARELKRADPNRQLDLAKGRELLHKAMKGRKLRPADKGDNSDA